jgi:flagellar motor switch protein FliN
MSEDAKAKGKAEFQSLIEEKKPMPEQENDLAVVLDIPVNLSVEIGSTHITVRNLLRLNQGSVVELDRLAGEALDIKVNGTLVAHGEVVVVNNKFGVRLTDVISTAERIKKLR